MSLVKVRRNGVLSIPASVRNQVGLTEGDMVEASVRRGRIVLTPKAARGRVVDDDYTATERRAIDARLAKALAEVKNGRVYGPFETVQEMAASLRRNSKKLKGKKNRLARR